MSRRKLDDKEEKLRSSTHLTTETFAGRNLRHQKGVTRNPMEDDDKDVESDSSTEQETIYDDADSAEVEKEEETEEKEQETSEEENEQDKKDEAEDEDAAILKEKLAKAEHVAENLKVALQQEREGKKQTQAPLLQPSLHDQNVDYGKAIAEQEEEAAKTVLFAEFPELKQENDPTNANYNRFVQDFALAARMRGVTPVRKEQFLALGRLVMTIRSGKVDTTEIEKKARTDATREALKANEANITTSRSSSKREEPLAATDADRRAAKAVNMSLEKYLKNKDVYDDGLPI